MTLSVKICYLHICIWLIKRYFKRAFACKEFTYCSLLYDIAYMNEQVILLLHSFLVFHLGALNCIPESITRLDFPPSRLPDIAEKMASHITTHYKFHGVVLTCLRVHSFSNHKPFSSYLSFDNTCS